MIKEVKFETTFFQTLLFYFYFICIKLIYLALQS